MRGPPALQRALVAELIADEMGTLGHQYFKLSKQLEIGRCLTDDIPKDEWGKYLGRVRGPR